MSEPTEPKELRKKEFDPHTLADVLVEKFAKFISENQEATMFTVVTGLGLLAAKVWHFELKDVKEKELMDRRMTDHVRDSLNDKKLLQKDIQTLKDNVEKEIQQLKERFEDKQQDQDARLRKLKERFEDKQQDQDAQLRKIKERFEDKQQDQEARLRKLQADVDTWLRIITFSRTNTLPRFDDANEKGSVTKGKKETSLGKPVEVKVGENELEPVATSVANGASPNTGVNLSPPARPLSTTATSVQSLLSVCKRLAK